MAMTMAAPFAMIQTQAASISGRQIAKASAAPVNASRANFAISASSSVSASRRSAIAFGAAVIPAVVSLPAWALIPDDEDEELLARAKANRVKTLAKEREVEKAFVREEGFKSKENDVAIGTARPIIDLASACMQEYQ
jgi:hypothetical protein